MFKRSTGFRVENKFAKGSVCSDLGLKFNGDKFGVNPKNGDVWCTLLDCGSGDKLPARVDDEDDRGSGDGALRLSWAMGIWSSFTGAGEPSGRRWVLICLVIMSRRL